MATQRTSSRSLKSIVGVTLAGLGMLLLLANMDALGASLSATTGHPTPEAPSLMPAFGLAAMHFVQAYTFDHAGFLAGLRQILLSFWPLILILAGATLLRSAIGGNFAEFKIYSGYPAKRERP